MELECDVIHAVFCRAIVKVEMHRTSHPLGEQIDSVHRITFRQTRDGFEFGAAETAQRPRVARNRVQVTNVFGGRAKKQIDETGLLEQIQNPGFGTLVDVQFDEHVAKVAAQLAHERDEGRAIVEIGDRP